jgi:hypothetical protein
VPAGKRPRRRPAQHDRLARGIARGDPRLAAWLAAAHGVTFRYGVAVAQVESGRVICADGAVLEAEAVFVCPGDDWATLYPAIYAEEGIRRCKLQMLRLAAPNGACPRR